MKLLLVCMFAHATMCAVVDISSSSHHNEHSKLDCSYSKTYPRQYVTSHLLDGEAIYVDGKLDEAAWAAVPWTEDFRDISTDTLPKFKTRAKVRWDDEYLYIGAWMEETDVWSNISHTCHCIDADADQVIFHDNDFEVFVDADGSNSFYKEFEM
jgi:hypothetical protein